MATNRITKIVICSIYMLYAYNSFAKDHQYFDKAINTIPITNPIAAIQTFIKASNTTVGHNFGYAVDISGNTIVVTDAIGLVYVFAIVNGNWTQQASITEDSGVFGSHVAISGDTIVIGNWSESSNANTIGGDPNNNLSPNSGAAYVFIRTGQTWTQQAYLKASDSGSHKKFGWSVDISNDTIVVGGQGFDQAYVYTRSGITWTEQDILIASDDSPLFDADFGWDVAISLDTIVVGSTKSRVQIGSFPQETGAAYIFKRTASVWDEQDILTALNPDGLDEFGFSVDIDGDTVVIGAHKEDSLATGINNNGDDNGAQDSGAAYVFTDSSGGWVQQAYIKAPNSQADDRFGYSVSIENNTIAVGAFLEDGDDTSSQTNSGAVYIYNRELETWSQTDYLKASNLGIQDQLGFSVAIDNGQIISGARFENSDTTGINPESNDSALDAGAAYLFTPERIFTDGFE